MLRIWIAEKCVKRGYQVLQDAAWAGIFHILVNMNGDYLFAQKWLVRVEKLNCREVCKMLNICVKIGYQVLWSKTPLELVFSHTSRYECVCAKWLISVEKLNCIWIVTLSTIHIIYELVFPISLPCKFKK